MKRSAILLALSLISLTGFAQYGRLEPLSPGDTLNLVLRTPRETLRKLQADTAKTTKKVGDLIERTERQLEIVRGGYLNNRTPTMNVAAFSSGIKWLQDQGVDVQYYLEEYFVYFPRSGQHVTKRKKD